MRVVLIAFLLASASIDVAAKVIQCERYTTSEDSAFKQDRTVFTFTFLPEEKSVVYEEVSGPGWFLPSGATLSPIWVASDNLRVVVSWLNSEYEKLDTAWHPVYVLDLDFQKPRYEMETYGGFSDFATLVSSPWKNECKRLD